MKRHLSEERISVYDATKSLLSNSVSGYHSVRDANEYYNEMTCNSEQGDDEDTELRRRFHYEGSIDDFPRGARLLSKRPSAHSASNESTTYKIVSPEMSKRLDDWLATVEDAYISLAEIQRAFQLRSIYSATALVAHYAAHFRETPLLDKSGSPLYAKNFSAPTFRERFVTLLDRLIQAIDPFAG